MTNSGSIILHRAWLALTVISISEQVELSRQWTNTTSQSTSKDKVNWRIQPLAIKRIQQFALPIVHLIKYPLSIILINFAGNEKMAAKTKWIRIFILCGTITVQTKYHLCQVPRLQVMYFCRCYCDIFTLHVPYLDLHRPSLDPSHSFVISYVGTAELWPPPV